MESSLLTVLPNLSIGVICVLSLLYVTHIFLKQIKEREDALRTLEKEVRTSIMGQLSENTTVMVRLLEHLNDKRHGR